MTMKRTGSSWMPADRYGKQLPKFSLNLLVRDVQKSLPFYRDILGATVHYADEDFAALDLVGFQFMLHSDHTYDHHPLYKKLASAGDAPRGNGAELRVMGIDPDILEKKARAAGVEVLQPAADYPHGWRDVMLLDPDGYIWAIGMPL
jgi:uncharacterized glyoxalase superfamily protein PhnB